MLKLLIDVLPRIAISSATLRSSTSLTPHTSNFIAMHYKLHAHCEYELIKVKAFKTQGCDDALWLSNLVESYYTLNA
jgi:hypothetical protein